MIIKYDYNSKYWLVNISYEKDFDWEFSIDETYLDIELSDFWNKKSWSFLYTFPKWNENKTITVNIKK